MALVLIAVGCRSSRGPDSGPQAPGDAAPPTAPEPGTPEAPVVPADAPPRPRATPAQPPEADADAEVGALRPAVSSAVFSQTNRLREARDRVPLHRDSTLARIACWHNQNMLANNYMGHRDADGRTPGDRMAREHRRLIGSAGENVYEGDNFRHRSGREEADDWAARIMSRWMESPGHRKNILRPEFTHLGACVTHTVTMSKATQMFAAVWGYLDEPLPWTPAAGDSLSVDVTPVKAPGPPAQYAFVPVGEPLGQAFQGGERGRPFDGTLVIPTAPGAYGTRFLFPGRQTNRYTVLSGPRILVQ